MSVAFPRWVLWAWICSILAVKAVAMRCEAHDQDAVANRANLGFFVLAWGFVAVGAWWLV